MSKNREDSNQLISSIQAYKKAFESGSMGTREECYKRINGYLEVNKERYFQILHTSEKVCLLYDVNEIEHE